MDPVKFPSEEQQQGLLNIAGQGNPTSGQN
jgi:hypothetical protein